MTAGDVPPTPDLAALVEEVLAAHVLGETEGGSATGSRCRCSCGEENYINSTRDMALRKARAHVAAELAQVVAAGSAERERELRAEVLREAATAFQINTWSDVITPALRTEGIPALAVGQAVVDWLRARANTVLRPEGGEQA